MFQDKTLVCKECGNEFVFTAGEQEFYAERGFQNEPQRCKACRDARKALPVAPRVFHRYLRCLRRRGQGALRAQVRPSRVLQRLLRPYARAGLTANLKRTPTGASFFCPLMLGKRKLCLEKSENRIYY